VRPGARGRGVGRRLLGHALDFARDAGLGEVYLQVAVSNDIAQRLYATLGFQRCRRLRAYYVDGEDAWLMRYGSDPEGADTALDATDPTREAPGEAATP